jgi:hypothetical protein
LGALSVFASAFLFYLASLYPAIAPRDSADMAAAAMTLGVAHPPGYPLYSLLGRGWISLIPVGNEAYRLGLLSAFAGAAAASLLFVFMKRRAGAAAGATTAAVWILSAPLWKFSVLQEKYSLHALFAVALLCLAEGTRENMYARARLSGLLVGLGLVNHQTLLFWLPAVAWLWIQEARRQDSSVAALTAQALLPAAAGLALNLFLWCRLGSLTDALGVALRSRYGMGVLFAGFARPLTADSAAALIVYAGTAIVAAVSWPAAVAALAGIIVARRAHATKALLFGAALTGPAFFLVSRFDVSNWVARSVLEPALLLPALVAAIFSGEAVAALSRRRAAWGAAGAAVIIAAAAASSPAYGEHRDDFLAYDYVRDLRRSVPPGGALLTAGDTASFGLRWLALFSPEARPREVSASGLVDPGEWLIAHEIRSDAFVSGLGTERLEALHQAWPAMTLTPAGLTQGISRGARTPPSVLRRPRAWSRDESYARDLKLSYAFASWVSARLLERTDPRAAETFDMTAVATDPEDYRLR